MTWTRYARRNHAPVSARLLQQAQRPGYFEDATGLGTGLHNHVWVNDSIYIPTHEQDALKDAVRSEIADTWTFLEDFCQRCRGALDRLGVAAERFNRDAAANPVAALTAWFHAYQCSMAFVPIFRTIDSVLAEHVTVQEAATFLDEEHATTITKESSERADLQVIAMQLRRIGDKAARSSLADELLDSHTRQYGWMKMRWYLGEPFAVDDFRDRVAALLAMPTTRQRPAPNGGTGLVTTERTRLLSELAFLRTHRADAINEAIWFVRDTLTRIAFSHEVSFDELVHLYPDEILDLVGGNGSNVDLDRARERRTSFATALLDDKFTEATGARDVDALSAELKLVEPQLASSEPKGGEVVLTGVAASRGEAIGPVRIIVTDDDINRLDDGDVLVTTMTYPSMVAAMQRSAAIVTDDGGLLSHAAVTARELGKPCIIDTGNATTLLRNGDIVHVRTDNASVRRLPENRRPREKS